jgi:hypothetical protein
LLSAVGVAVVAAWLAVTTLAQAAEFTCKVPWYTDTDCKLPKFSIPPGGKLTIEVYTVKKDGVDIFLTKDRCPVFKILDVNNDDRLLKALKEMCAKTSQTYENPLKSTEQVVYLRVNVNQGNDIYIDGKYTVTK